MGTASNMAIDENLALAYRRGQRRGIKWGITHHEHEYYRELLKNAGPGAGGAVRGKSGAAFGRTTPGADPFDGNDEKTQAAPFG